MLRSDTLMLDNKLFPLYQERVTCPTFTTEHTNEQFCCDDDDDEEQFLVMLGTGRRAAEQQRIELMLGLLSEYLVFYIINSSRKIK